MLTTGETRDVRLEARICPSPVFADIKFRTVKTVCAKCRVLNVELRNPRKSELDSYTYGIFTFWDFTSLPDFSQPITTANSRTTSGRFRGCEYYCILVQTQVSVCEFLNRRREYIALVRIIYNIIQ